MATTPTDDPVVNGNRTVGVRYVLSPGTFRSLKRDALLFDQIGIPLYVDHLGSPVHDELCWLRDICIVRDIPAPDMRPRYPARDAIVTAITREYVDAIFAETGWRVKPFDDCADGQY